MIDIVNPISTDVIVFYPIWHLSASQANLYASIIGTAPDVIEYPITSIPNAIKGAADKADITLPHFPHGLFDVKNKPMATAINHMAYN